MVQYLDMNQIWLYIETEQERNEILESVSRRFLDGDKVRVKEYSERYDGKVAEVFWARFDPYSPADSYLTVKIKETGELVDLGYGQVELIGESNLMKGNSIEQKVFDFLMEHDHNNVRSALSNVLQDFVKRNLEGGEIESKEIAKAVDLTISLAAES